MSKPDLAKLARLTPEAARMARALDWVLVAIFLFLVIGIFHLHFMLFAGDWDFWLDWKDREWWPVVTPIAGITFPAVVSYILWANFRLSFGATFCALALLVGQWMTRYWGYHLWSNFPVNLVLPATLIPGALILDSVLLLTRSWLFTALLGGGLFGLLFYPANWPIFGPFHLPVEVDGVLLSLSDYIGFLDIRTATPEYVRSVEQGSLRTFGGHTTAIAAAFAGFVCILMYAFWWQLGRVFCSAFYYVNKRGQAVRETETAALAARVQS